jgi:uncharacterized protein HemY
MRLAEVSARGPNAAFANYLIGRRLIEEAQWIEAASYLRAAEADSVLRVNPEIHLETLKLLGQALYRSRLWDEARERFTSVAASARYEAERREAESWIERCRWRSAPSMALFPRPLRSLL